MTNIHPWATAIECTASERRSVEALIGWYEINRRDLPWRRTRDPYCIWLSEVILQQTRVAQGLSYYERFVAAFPTVHALAAADEDDVMRLWQGLGYYSRARNLLAGARQVVREWGGAMPEDHRLLLTIKGVGRYTAAAVASFAFGLPHAVVDGNVYRVLARWYDIELPIDHAPSQRLFAALAQRLLPSDRSADYNQAIMELGALVCTPKSPSCSACPLRVRCLALDGGTVAERPVKGRAVRVRERHFLYFEVIDPQGCFYLVRREAKDIWLGLYELPMVEVDFAIDEAAIGGAWRELLGGVIPALRCGAAMIEAVCPLPVHQLTHQRIFASVVRLRSSVALPAQLDCYIVSHSAWSDYPLPQLLHNYFRASREDVAKRSDDCGAVGCP